MPTPMIRRLLRQFVNDDLSSKEQVTNWMGHIFLSAEIYETIFTVPLSLDNIPAWKTCERRLWNGRRPTILQMSFFAYARRQNPSPGHLREAFAGAPEIKTPIRRTCPPSPPLNTGRCLQPVLAQYQME